MQLYQQINNNNEIQLKIPNVVSHFFQDLVQKQS